MGIVLTEVHRGDAVESRHTGAVAIARPGAELGAGGAEQPVWCRSAVKPFQALPLFDRGIVDDLGLDDRELAVISASHNGTDEHVAVVEGLLHRAGLGPDDLACGPHAPFDQRAARAIARAGDRPRRIHNNCSGKHAGFLLLARALGQPIETYLEPGGAAQQLVVAAVADMAGVPSGDVALAVDGCGAPTLRLPLCALARAFLRLVNPEGIGDVREAGCRRLWRAISAAPVLLAGRGRLCTALVESAPGRIYPKNGAEGIYAFGALTPDGPVGVAIKVDDGAERGYVPAVIALLRELGVWNEVPRSLAEFARIPVVNTQKRLVGDVRCAVGFPPRW